MQQHWKEYSALLLGLQERKKGVSIQHNFQQHWGLPTPALACSKSCKDFVLCSSKKFSCSGVIWPTTWAYQHHTIRQTYGFTEFLQSTQDFHSLLNSCISCQLAKLHASLFDWGYCGQLAESTGYLNIIQTSSEWSLIFLSKQLDNFRSFESLTDCRLYGL